MLPARALPVDRIHRTLVPRYLTAADHVWLAELLAEFERHVGRRRSELEQRLAEPLGFSAPRSKLEVARRVLSRAYSDRTRAPVSPARIREVLFGARAREPSRAAALERACAALGLSPEAVQESLFADLPSERRLAPLKQPLGAGELALLANQAIVSALLRRARVVRIEAEGDARALVRAVKLRGLLCAAEPNPRGRSVRLVVSGPFALFRHTLVYGRALSSLTAVVARCRRFELRATCALFSDRDLAELVVKSGDPVVPASLGRAYDSKLEERFARDFGKLALDWDIVREPEAVPVAGAWIFPDFLLRHRRDPRRRALLEIVGFWTPEYLERKLSALRRAKVGPLILCIDANRNCSDGDLPEHASVVRFKRRVPAAEVLAALQRIV